jgi:hypothetical protein
METLLKHSAFNFYDFYVKAKNPKTNEIVMVNWFQGLVVIEKKNECEWVVSSFSKEVMDFWVKQFGDDMFYLEGENSLKLNKILKKTAKFINAPFIKGCALTKEWIRYEIIG